MNLITLTKIKIKSIPRKKIFNWALLVIFASVIIAGYFLGKNASYLNLAGVLPALNLTKVTQNVSSVPEEKIEIIIPQTKIYEEVAEPGEGITHLARKAVREYLKDKGEGLNLTKEHKIYIEDYLQKKTGDYYLQIGQKLSFEEKLIKEAIDKAVTLTPEQLQNLTQYSQLVLDL